MSTRRIEFVYPAPPGDRFAPGAFDGRIGQPISISRKVTEHYSVVLSDGILRVAEVVDDGQAVRCVVEVPDTVSTHTLPF